MESSEILKSLGLNDKNKWILYDDKAYNFFKYCDEYLNNKNCLTEAENLIFNDFILSTEFDENIKKEDELKYAGILSINEDSIKENDNYATLIEEENEERLNRILKMQEYARKDKSLYETEIQSDVHLVNQISAKIKHLDNMQSLSIQRNSASTRNLQSSANFLFQMPNDQLFLVINKISDSMDFFMRKNFKIDGNHQLDEEFQRDPIVDLTSEKERIIKLQRIKLESELNLAGINYAMEHINDKVKIIINKKSADKKVFIKDWIFEEENQKLELETMLQELQILYAQQPPFKKFFDDFCLRKSIKNT